MSFKVSDWPTVDDVDRYAEEMPGVPREDIVRDIVRTISVAKMVADGTLNDDWVLCGGMAMRLRGSPRFTRLDTDTSRRGGLPTDATLASALRIDEEALIVEAAGFTPGKQLVTVMPVEFRAYFIELGTEPATDDFKFTVSGRGLIEHAESLELTHPYTELVLPPTTVPLMDLTEQLAEKICGWCIHGLVKHYIDVAWAFLTLENEIRSPRLGPLVEAKLKIGRGLFPDSYKDFPSLKPVLKALHDPREHIPPLGDESDKREALRFTGTALDYERAIQIVRSKTLPALLADKARR